MNPHSSDSEIFDELQSLVGLWEGVTDRGRTLKVSYTLHARNSVLVETWTLGPTSSALTLYHMDQDRLMATHYCPLRNQPRLLLSQERDGSTLQFKFDSATNLPSLDIAHQESFELRLIGPDSFWRSETYVENGIGDSDGVTYYRIVT